MQARLTDGSVIDLTKNCACLDRIHEGPHWIHIDTVTRESNERLRECGNISGFVVVEGARLRHKIFEMEKRGIKELLVEDEIVRIDA